MDANNHNPLDDLEHLEAPSSSEGDAEVPNNASQSSNEEYSGLSSTNDYRHYEGFPYFISPDHPSTPELTYSRLLLSSGNGCALWAPTPKHVIAPTVPVDELNLGDIGFISSNSQFVFAFNIFLPAEHPAHTYGVPPDFVPLSPLLPSELKTDPQYLPPGSVLSSLDVESTRLSDHPLHISFRSSAPESAILVLPDGCSRQDITPSGMSRVKQYLQTHSLEFYKFLTEQCDGTTPSNASLMLITGIDYATSYASACDSERSFHVGSHKLSMEFKGGELHSHCSASTSSSPPLRRKTEEGKSPRQHPHAVFIRGTRMALDRLTWLDHLQDPPERHARYMELMMPPVSPVRHLVSGFRSKFANRVMRTKAFIQHERITKNPNFTRHPFHPSIILAHIMLSDSPESTLVLLDEDLWFPVFESGKAINPKPPPNSSDRDLSTGTLPCVIEWIAELLENNRIVEIDGLRAIYPASSLKEIDDPYQIIDVPQDRVQRVCWLNDMMSALIEEGTQHRTNFSTTSTSTYTS
ncbi:hypothetical protein CVT24_009252 [Panaeolus cyanescens]|uniref:Uncharacterized protein n=1 Tax=Panaeolus cyanescens TaxID=181874 RepID=A0A409Y8M2_9AGAR|nr:hypothetical protein CVT24_009252 [Panaeolus cyanescens]